MGKLRHIAMSVPWNTAEFYKYAAAAAEMAGELGNDLLLRRRALTRLAALGTPGASKMRHPTGARTRTPRGRTAGEGGPGAPAAGG
jgi:hypothetical protein